MEVFTIVANEVIGLSATECTLIQFSYNPEQIRDPESVLRSAVKDYLKTDEGKRQLEINCGCWNWGDVDDIPGSFFLNYGLAKIAPPDVNAVVDHNESLRMTTTIARKNNRKGMKKCVFMPQTAYS